MTGDRGGLPLGKATTYPDRYDPSVLYPMSRAAAREASRIARPLPFSGVDIWTAHEITWLDARGKPRVAVGEFRVGADSPSLVESKSVKLYLGSFAQERVGTPADLAQTIRDDLSRACGAMVETVLMPPTQRAPVAELPGESIDSLDVEVDAYLPDAGLLKRGTTTVQETLRSALFRSTCPVTGQPDYADVLVRYRGARIDRTALLEYLVSYRQHAAFHEACVERIFVDIAERCSPDQLTVYARFLRRGGIDINPFRSNFEAPPVHNERTPRQ